MKDKFEWKNFYLQEPIIKEDVYFKFACFYMTSIELYDRLLTTERSPYDKTEAYFCGTARQYKHFSDLCARNLYDCVAQYIIYKTGSFDIARWKEQSGKIHSAQGWINMFENYKRENDEIILDMIENIWNYDKNNGKNQNNERKTIFIKRPF